MNRSINGIDAFDDDTDRRIFLTQLRDAALRYSVEIHGYALMTNHYHLLLHTPKCGLSPAMQRIACRFTQAVNRRRGRDGPLFRGRFTSLVIEDDAHLGNVSAYIHLNPIAAGLASRPEDWPWSSAASYLGKSAEHDWLRTDAVLAMFGAHDAKDAYRAFVEERGRSLERLGSDPSQQAPPNDGDRRSEGSDPMVSG